MEAGLQRKTVLILAGLVLIVSLAVAQSPSSDFPPDELLQHITADGLRAHMAFLSDDLMEGRGIGTRGYQLAANYVRAQFEQMGLKPAGTNGSYFQNVRFRKIELQRDKSSVSIKNNGLNRSLIIEKDYVMAGDPLSTDARVEGSGRVRRLRCKRSGIRLRRLRRHRGAGKNCGCDLWRSSQATLRSRGSFLFL